MVATYTEIFKDHLASGRRVSVGTIDLGAYSSGGVAVAAATFGVSSIDALQVIPSGGYVPVWDSAESKIKAYVGDNDGGADGPMAEFAGATVAGISFPITVYGDPSS